MNSKISICCVSVLFMLLSCKTNVLILNSSEGVNQVWSKSNSVKSVRRAFAVDSMLIVNRDKTKNMVSCESVWGVMYKDGTIYRNYDDQYFLLRQNSTVQIYSQSHAGYKTSSTSYYFSNGLNSKIYSLKWKNIKREFQSDTCFLNKLQNELRWFQDYSSYDRKKKTFLVVKFYNDCQKR